MQFFKQRHVQDYVEQYTFVSSNKQDQPMDAIFYVVCLFHRIDSFKQTQTHFYVSTSCSGKTSSPLSSMTQGKGSGFTSSRTSGM